jgi:hypothetical protein
VVPLPSDDLSGLTRRFIEAGSRGDLDAVMTFFGRDPVWDDVDLNTSYGGVSAVREFLAECLGRHRGHGIESEEISDLGRGVVFAIARRSAPDSDGRYAEGLRGAWAYTIQVAEGVIVRVTAHSDTRAARAATERLIKGGGGDIAGKRRPQ